MVREKEKDLGACIEEIFRKIGVDYIVLDEGKGCCGTPLIISGNKDKLEDLVKETLSIIKGEKVSTVVSPCPTCIKTFRRFYSKEISFKHFIEYINDLAKNNKISFKKKLNIKAAYHDPCDLARGLGVIDAPRELLKLIGVELIEMKSTREESMCCGAGGGLWFAYPHLSTELSLMRLKEVIETGARVLVTACPTCEHRFKSTIDAENMDIECKDIAELLLEVI